jgi:two-component sensor histidine kinase
VNIFAILSFISFILFVQAGFLALWKNHKALTSRVFAFLCLLFAVYAGGYTLFFDAETLEQVYFYDRIASIGWIFFPIVTVWFSIIFTNSKNKVIKGILLFFLLPISVYSLYVAITDLESVKFFYINNGNWFFTPYDTTSDYYLFILYLIASVLVSYYVLISWFFMAESNREKYKAKIMLYILTIFFILSFFTNLVFPFLQSQVIPAMAPINALILVGGIAYLLFFLPTASIPPSVLYNLIVQNVNEFLFLADSKGKIYATNHYTLAHLKYNSYEISRSSISEIFSDKEKIEDALRSLGTRNVSKQIRVDLISQTNERIPVLLYVIKVNDHFKRTRGFVFSCLDYRQKLKLRDEVAERVRTEKNLSQLRRELELLVKKRTRELQDANLRLQQEVIERRSAEEQIKTDLHEKVKLVQEIHHRVKNNIQMVISLVNMLCNHPKIDSHASDKLREIAEKVRYISRIHEDFYSSPNLSNIAFSGYLKKAIGELYSNYGRRKDIVFKLNLTDENLDIGQAIPLGIIFNELLKNSLLYAFEREILPDEKSIINIEFYKNNGHYSLIVSDNGIGLQAPLNEIQSKKIGLQLVNVLVKEHLKGSVSHDGQFGTTFTVKFYPTPDI